MSAKCQKRTSMDRANAGVPISNKPRRSIAIAGASWSRAQAERDLRVVGDGTVKKKARSEKSGRALSSASHLVIL
jgi:hypothetical protein